MKVERTERGWGGHFICSPYCLFRRNTLLTCGEVRIVVSTVGNYMLNDKVKQIGLDRYFETMAFHSDPEDTRYFDADVTREVSFKSPWSINKKDADDEANDMHETVVAEIIEILHRGVEC
jgi:hypothetical protein